MLMVLLFLFFLWKNDSGKSIKHPAKSMTINWSKVLLANVISIASVANRIRNRDNRKRNQNVWNWLSMFRDQCIGELRQYLNFHSMESIHVKCFYSWTRIYFICQIQWLWSTSRSRARGGCDGDGSVRRIWKTRTIWYRGTQRWKQIHTVCR